MIQKQAERCDAMSSMDIGLIIFTRNTDETRTEFSNVFSMRLSRTSRASLSNLNNSNTFTDLIDPEL